MDQYLIDALKAKYEAQMAEAYANIQVYLNNPAGIGEHPDLVVAIDTQVEIYANAKEKLGAMNEF
mgnify:CR=1 FL=1|tara:strand:+ start:494 stop:688 length:195 start_codon:yes stop_codon:yes gene_type:complete